MEIRSVAAHSDVAVAVTSARVTPTPPRASRFGEVLSNTVVRSAESAVRMLPGSPVMAVAVRGGAGMGSTPLSLPLASGTGAGAAGRGPEGPLTSSARVGTSALGTSALATGTGALATGTGAVTGAGETADIQSSLQHSQDMNIEYLRIQEQVNDQNRQFTTISNLLKAEHDTVKTAIGNIR